MPTTHPPNSNSAPLPDSNSESNYLQDRDGPVPFAERGDGIWEGAIGSLFHRSRFPRSYPDGILRCSVTPRGGQEGSLSHSILGSPTIPPLLARSSGYEGFHLELINTVENPCINDNGVQVDLYIGQVVWRTYLRETSTGLQRIPDGFGPYIIIEKTQSHLHYVLMGTDGLIYPTLVPVQDLIPCLTSWHAIRIPRALVMHPNVQDLINNLGTE
jgi:hypothetical protein